MASFSLDVGLACQTDVRVWVIHEAYILIDKFPINISYAILCMHKRNDFTKDSFNRGKCDVNHCLIRKPFVINKTSNNTTYLDFGNETYQFAFGIFINCIPDLCCTNTNRQQIHRDIKVHPSKYQIILNWITAVSPRAAFMSGWITSFDFISPARSPVDSLHNLSTYRSFVYWFSYIAGDIKISYGYMNELDGWLNGL